jgi:precorrin-4 methylase
MVPAQDSGVLVEQGVIMSASVVLVVASDPPAVVVVAAGALVVSEVLSSLPHAAATMASASINAKNVRRLMPSCSST